MQPYGPGPATNTGFQQGQPTPQNQPYTQQWPGQQPWQQAGPSSWQAQGQPSRPLISGFGHQALGPLLYNSEALGSQGDGAQAYGQYAFGQQGRQVFGQQAFGPQAYGQQQPFASQAGPGSAA